jgi:predicted alpha-1,2-mannosidase
MKFNLAFLILILSFTSFGQKVEYSKWVNPFIGTGGHGHTYPGATVPFGFVQLSPDTRLEGWDGCGGYHYSDSIIYGFSHTHLSGTGVSDLGDLLIMPFNGENFWDYGTSPANGYGSYFSHENETAYAGYYNVKLDKSNINVELTADIHSGFHRYTFTKHQPKKIIIDLEHRDHLLDSDLFFLNDSTLVGKRISSAWAQEQHVYFVIKLSEKPTKKFTHKNKLNKTTKLILEFDSPSKELLIKTGISAVDILGAQANLNAEIPHWDFDVSLKKATDLWQKELSKIELTTNDLNQKTIFYTALYHTYIVPNMFSDVDGRFRGTDLKVHKSNQTQYTVFSLWDTFRATHPLYTITQQDRTLDFINTFLNHYKYGGKLPVWELDGNYTMCMIGYHSVSVISDAYAKGITDFDTDLALEAMIHSATLKHLGLYYYIKNGYISSEFESESVSKTLEYAYDDWCIAEFAKNTGKDSIANVYYKRALSYKNIFNPENKFMHPKFNGEFKPDFNPKEVTFDYTEANAWQYSLFVPQDIQGLRMMLGGKDSLAHWLDRLFTETSQTVGRHQVDITGLIGQYAHGNEPSHHMAYLYNFTNHSFKTQYYTRKILTELYSNQPDGLSGNEDCGQMSAWYVLSSLGIYAVSPGSDVYQLTTPLFNEAKIHLENGNTFKIVAQPQSPEHIYIKSITLNGKIINKNYITHQDIIKGGTLTFELSDSPQKKAVRCASQHINLPFLAVPYFKNASPTFSKKLNVSIHNPNKSGQIKYQLSSAPKKVKTYKKPIKFKKTDSLTAWVEKDTLRSYKVTSSHIKVNHKWVIVLNSTPHSQYTADNPKALIDKQYGSNDFRNGYWQGFYAKDMDVEINLKKKKEINAVKVHVLQDANSWIWYPTEIEFYYWNKGQWIKYDVVKNNVSEKEYGGLTQYITSNKKIKSNKIKIVAKNIGNCPDWHPGAGNPAFIFADEIEIETK